MHQGDAFCSTGSSLFLRNDVYGHGGRKSLTCGSSSSRSAHTVMGVKSNQIHVVHGALARGESVGRRSKKRLKSASASRRPDSARGGSGREITDNKLPVFWEVGTAAPKSTSTARLAKLKYFKKFVSVADVGKAIHPEHCVAQEEGAAMQGIGHTFFEQFYLLQPPAAQSESGRLSYPIFFPKLPEEFHTQWAEERPWPRGMLSACAAWPKVVFSPSVAPLRCNAIDRGDGGGHS